MKDEVTRWMRMGRVVELMYVDRHGVISKRRVKLMKLQGEQVIAWDIMKQARRTFCIERILACLPMVDRKFGGEEGVG
ncbi:hypothetical protein EVJ27_10810 [Exiguobacterium sp. SH3S2]|uniref:hypothetical protein n=1 Tax=unclassified Exiguobacterium TaxID=2644629 RepID=UPI001039AB41|nr:MULTISPECIES: hypothetical protein [unclassified Exiguobacterium]TCI43131.1 hypothetical protein EVJ28_10830 [Exiguobacterium sp. SH3S3]TCI58902.1 hypothetical protein EVJ27_10810 [Exiguobacterium sp. SH3S2]